MKKSLMDALDRAWRQRPRSGPPVRPKNIKTKEAPPVQTGIVAKRLAERAYDGWTALFYEDQTGTYWTGPIRSLLDVYRAQAIFRIENGMVQFRKSRQMTSSSRITIEEASRVYGPFFGP